MEPLRTWIRNRPWLAAWLVAALFARALVPIGYMPGAGGVELCSGYAHSAPNGGHGDPECRYAAAVVPLGSPHVAPTVAYAPISSFEVPLPADRPAVHATVVPTRLPRGPPA